MSADWLHQTETGVRIELLIQPRASKSEVVGEHDGRLKLRLKAPPVDGAANKELLSFLSKRIKIPKRSIHLNAGATGRRKTLDIDGVDVAQVRSALSD